MSREMHAFLIILAASLVTIALRFLPFLIFNGKRKTPPYILFLGRVLPFAIMGMLVVYCLRNTVLFAAPYGIPELIACLSVVLFHIWKRNSLLSIGGGTLIYMMLVQFVF